MFDSMLSTLIYIHMLQCSIVFHDCSRVIWEMIFKGKLREVEKNF